MTKLTATDYTYMSIHDGLVLVRNRTGKFDDWEKLTRLGKWENGCELMGPFVFKGEIGDEPVSLDEARAIAKKLGGTIDGAVASEEEVRAMQAEWEAEYGD